LFNSSTRNLINSRTVFFILSVKAKYVSIVIRNTVFFISIVVLLTIQTASSELLSSAHAEATVQNCSGCINNTKTQILTIFNFQTEDYPFLAGNATFIVVPNPYAHTTNATDYLDLTTWFNFVVSDGDRFDKDPTPGIIELVGVNNGTYSVMQIKGSPGFGITKELSASDDIFGTTGYAHVTQTFVNFTVSSIIESIEPPHISDETFSRLKNTGGAKVNGVTISSANDLPPAIIVNTVQKITSSPPEHVVFTLGFLPNTTPDTLFDTLGIPAYSAPKGLAISEQSTFIPPVFVAPVLGGGNFIMSPILDEIQPGSNIMLRYDGVDQGTSHPLIKAIVLPMNTFGKNVGVSIKVDTSNPTGVPIPSGNVALFLDFEETGNINFGDDSVYSSNPVMYFNVEKDGTSCPTGVIVYLLDSGHWHEVAPGPTRDPAGDTSRTCAYSVEVDHFSSYLVGSGSSGGHDHDDSPSHTDHPTDHPAAHGASHSSHSTHSHASHVGHEGYEGMTAKEAIYHQITRDLNIFEITYDRAEAVVRITIGITGSIDDVEVQTYSKEGGVRTARLVQDQQGIVSIMEQSMRKYVFEVPLHPSDVVFSIYVDDKNYNLSQTVDMKSISGKVIPWYANMHDEHAEHNNQEHSDNAKHDSDASNTGFEIKFDGGKKIVSYNNNDFTIKYEMAGSITGIEVDEDSKAVTFLLDSVSSGELLLQVPRSLVDALNDNVVVLVSASPESEIEYEIIASTFDYYTLKVTLPEGADRLTIIGSSVVPEFGMFSVLVLVASIIGIIVILKTQRHNLQYN
jgi:predicted secreted protein with PEFG-CTERM motif